MRRAAGFVSSRLLCNWDSQKTAWSSLRLGSRNVQVARWHKRTPWRSKLLDGIAVQRTCHGLVRFIMENGTSATKPRFFFLKTKVISPPLAKPPKTFSRPRSLQRLLGEVHDDPVRKLPVLEGMGSARVSDTSMRDSSACSKLGPDSSYPYQLATVRVPQGIARCRSQGCRVLGDTSGHERRKRETLSPILEKEKVDMKK